MKELLAILDRLPEFGSLLAALDAGGCPAAVSGLAAVHRAHFAAGVRARTGRPVVLVCADETEAARLSEDLHALTGEEVLRLSAREFTFHDAAAASRQWEHRRLAVFRAMQAGRAPLVAATVDALLQRTLPPEVLERTALTLRVGEVRDLPALTEVLSAAGYARCQQVEGTGQFALRGGILDFFSPACDRPVRCEFFGTRSTPWASSTRTPSGGRKTSRRSRSCRWRRCCPSGPQGVCPACWRPWTASWNGFGRPSIPARSS